MKAPPLAAAATRNTATGRALSGAVSSFAVGTGTAASVRPAMSIKLGEDVTETLELVPHQWKVIQTVREKLSCRACERISQPPAPHHAIPRGRAGPGLLAMTVCDKFAMHLPLTRQSHGRRGHRD